MKYSNIETARIAKLHKFVLWAFLAGIASYFIPLGGVSVIITSVFLVVLMYQLANALKSKAAILYVIAAFIPVIALFALLHLNQKSVEAVRAKGYKVGLMGASSTDIKKMEQELPDEIEKMNQELPETMPLD